MPALFVDTSGWGCLFDQRHPLHQQARILYLGRSYSRFVTTNYVLNELSALLSSPLRVPRPQIIQILTRIRESKDVEIVHITPDLDEQAWQLFKSRPDKTWSLTDCASFVVMQQRGIKEALTEDRHFEQAGFVRLLR